MYIVKTRASAGNTSGKPPAIQPGAMNPLTTWQTWLQAANLSPQTIRLRAYQMSRFARSHPDLLGVGVDSLVEWLGRPQWSTDTKRSQRAALRSFYGWAHATGLIETDPSRLLPKIQPAKHQPRPAPEDVIESGLASADERTRLMIILGAREGMRRGEIAKVHSDDLIRDLTGWSLVVHGKGRKERIIPLADDVATMLLARPAGWAFPGGVDGHLSDDRVGVLLSRALPGHWTAHPLRHRFGTVVYRRTGDIRAVQELLGHESLATTQQYVGIDEDTLRAAVLAAA